MLQQILSVTDNFIPAFRRAVFFWNLYWGKDYYVFLFGAGILFLLLVSRRRKPVRESLPVLFSGLLLFFFPVSAFFVQKMIGEDVFWRILWILPVLPLLALALTEGIRISRKMFRPFAVLLCAALIILSGTDMIRAGFFERMYNSQKVPTEIPHISRLLHEQEAIHGQDRVYIAADDHLVTWMRIYDPSVLQAYGRYGRSPVNSWAARIYEEIMSDEPDYDVIADNISNLTVNFILLPVTDETLADQLCGYGWEMVGHINDYYIYYVTENGEKLIRQQEKNK